MPCCCCENAQVSAAGANAEPAGKHADWRRWGRSPDTPNGCCDKVMQSRRRTKRMWEGVVD